MLDQLSIEELALVRAVLKHALKEKIAVKKLLSEVSETMLDKVETPFNSVKKVKPVPVVKRPVQKVNTNTVVEVEDLIEFEPQPGHSLEDLRLMMREKRLPRSLMKDFMLRVSERGKLKEEGYTLSSIDDFLLTGDYTLLNKPGEIPND